MPGTASGPLLSKLGFEAVLLSFAEAGVQAENKELRPTDSSRRTKADK